MKYDPAYQDQFLPRPVHEIHERPRNAARVRLRLRTVVSLSDLGPFGYSGQAARSSALEYLRNLGIRIRDIEKVDVHPFSNFAAPHVSITAIVENAADRIESDDGSASQ